jgi:hypothetical protein
LLSAGDPAGTPTNGRAAPERVRIRPTLSEWSDDELMTLSEAVALFWPGRGPVTLTTIRTAVRNGALDIVPIAGKHFTTKASILRMTTPRPQPTSPPAPLQILISPAPARAPVPGIDPVIERIRARSERAKTRA